MARYQRSVINPLTRVNEIASQGSVKLQGVPELRAALEAVGQDVATKLGRRADRTAAQRMAAVMKETAPASTADNRSPASKTYGHLRDNIRVRLGRARVEGAIVYNITVGKAFWGFFQEFGTRHQQAYPWMRPAFDVTVRGAIDTQIDVLRAGIEATAKRAARIGKRA